RPPNPQRILLSSTLSLLDSHHRDDGIHLPHVEFHPAHRICGFVAAQIPPSATEALSACAGASLHVRRYASYHSGLVVPVLHGLCSWPTGKILVVFPSCAGRWSVDCPKDRSGYPGNHNFCFHDDRHGNSLQVGLSPAPEI